MRAAGQLAQLIRARLFQLLDTTGFIRYLFGPKVLDGFRDGFAFQYTDPRTTDPATTTGLASWAFGNGANQDDNETRLFALANHPANGDYSAVIAARSTEFGNGFASVALNADQTTPAKGAAVNVYVANNASEVALSADLIYFNGRRKSNFYVDSGSVVAVTNAAQEISFNYNVTFTFLPQVTAINGDRLAAAFYCAVNGKTVVGITIRCEGAGVGSTVRVDWIAVGLI